MIPDRGLTKKTSDLTWARYQEMPMIPATRNVYSARIVEGNQELPEGKRLPKHTPKKAKVKKEDAQKRKGETLRAMHMPRILAEIATAFAKGPITVFDLAEIRKTTLGGARITMQGWRKRKLAMVVGTVLVSDETGLYPRKVNLWDRVK